MKSLKSFWQICTLGVIISNVSPAGCAIRPQNDNAWNEKDHRQDVNKHSIQKRSPSVQDRENCNAGDAVPATRIDTSSQLANLRSLMQTLPGVHDKPIQAYIIPMDEEHQSEYVAAHDKRVQYISGFSGSAGVAIVTTQYAALWTDGRYHLQAESELDCNWILMKEGVSNVPFPVDWLGEVLVAGDRVSSDPSVLSYDSWIDYLDSLYDMEMNFTEVSFNLVDRIWNDASRPAKPVNDIVVLNITYSGETWQSKVERIRTKMRSCGVSAVVINYLDESAWLYNLRGEDIEYNPVFFSYSIVELEKTSLFILNATSRLSDNTLKEHLSAVYGSDSCSQGDCVQVYDYNDFYTILAEVCRNTIHRVWVSPMSSYQIYSTVSRVNYQKIYLKPSIVRLLKGRKNPTEVQGMRNSQKRDSAALIEFICMLEQSVKSGEKWTEIKAASALEMIRRAQPLNRGLSFPSISASGANGAIIHYRPSNVTNTDITTKDMYLIDSGGQYLDGTTDVTRTYHFGQPTDFEKEAYTRVLMGCIDLAMSRWPNGTYGRDIDILARQPLWAVGLDYRHGTGHGLGAFLNVHEGPGRINYGYRPDKYESPLYGEMFFSDEPGYYEDGSFGVRLETIVMTKKVTTKYEFGELEWLGFEPFTLVPFEPHLINFEWLNSNQKKWLNMYNARCLQEVGVDILKAQNKMDAYEWVKHRTSHIPDISVSRSTAAEAEWKFSYLVIITFNIFFILC